MTFNEEYEEFIENVVKSIPLTWRSPTLVSRLKDKRAFGLQKYGDKSYQLSLENSMKVDTVQHAEEELDDFVNYILHEIFKASRSGTINNIARCKKLLEVTLDLYEGLKVFKDGE